MQPVKDVEMLTTHLEDIKCASDGPEISDSIDTVLERKYELRRISKVDFMLSEWQISPKDRPQASSDICSCLSALLFGQV